MKGTAVILLCVFVLAAFIAPARAAADSGGLRQLAQFEGGALYGAGPVKVVDLRGSYRQMGRQYGHLMRKDLRALYDAAITGEYMQKQKFTPERLKTIAYSFYDLYPLRYREIFKGMAETSGMTLDELVLLNAIEFFPKINHLQYNCSALAVWGDYTKDRSVVFGRNNDDSPFFKEFASFVNVVVFRPGDGSNPTAIVNYAGAMYAPNGLNSKGVFLELNGGPWEGFYLKRPTVFVSLFTFLQDFSTLDQVSAALASTKMNMCSIVTMADKDKACSLECSSREAKMCKGEREGIVAAANHFVHPDWELSQLDDRRGGLTMTRRNNLLALGERFKGQFDAGKMMEVFDTTIENGGATSPEGTIFQIVAVPGKLVMWIKAPGAFDWTEVDLSRLLKD